ncbi:MAG: hypothetical protein ABIJ61_05090, partial [bacterium]
MSTIKLDAFNKLSIRPPCNDHIAATYLWRDIGIVLVGNPIGIFTLETSEHVKTLIALHVLLGQFRLDNSEHLIKRPQLAGVIGETTRLLQGTFG